MHFQLADFAEIPFFKLMPGTQAIKRLLHKAVLIRLLSLLWEGEIKDADTRRAWWGGGSVHVYTLRVLKQSRRSPDTNTPYKHVHRQKQRFPIQAGHVCSQPETNIWNRLKTQQVLPASTEQEGQRECIGLKALLPWKKKKSEWKSSHSLLIHSHTSAHHLEVFRVVYELFLWWMHSLLNNIHSWASLNYILQLAKGNE